MSSPPSIQAAWNLAPALELMLLGLALALVPLAWCWRRERGSGSLGKLRALSVLTLFLTFDLVLFGAFTRLTDSGLGCPDWPGCYGKASPFAARADIALAEQALPGGPVTHTKAWIEMLHRYLASMIGVLTIAMAAVSWRLRRAGRSDVNPWWPTFALLWIGVQGAFGAWTVTMQLFPTMVVLHLLGGSILLALLCASALRTADRAAVVPIRPGQRRWLWLLLAALLGQSALGGWVSANYAVLACTDFPTCQGSWWPPMDFAAARQIWRPLGLLPDGSPLTFEALVAMHYTHRLGAYALALLVALVLWRLRDVPLLAAPRRCIAALLLLQLISGISNVLFAWPLLVAVLHTGGAAALVLATTWALAASRSAVPRILPGAAHA